MVYEAVKKLRHVAVLSLARCGLHESAYVRLASAASAATRLAWLNLSKNTPLTTEGATRVATALVESVGISTLVCAGCFSERRDVQLFREIAASVRLIHRDDPAAPRLLYRARFLDRIASE